MDITSFWQSIVTFGQKVAKQELYEGKSISKETNGYEILTHLVDSLFQWQKFLKFSSFAPLPHS